MVHDAAAEQHIRDHAARSGMISLRKDGMRWVAEGLTSFEEIVRVTRES